ncbi:hypothetical protein D3C80_1968100 [compost metagenome]
MNRSRITALITVPIIANTFLRLRRVSPIIPTTAPATLTAARIRTVSPSSMMACEESLITSLLLLRIEVACIPA